MDGRDVFGMEAVGGGDMAFGSARGGVDGFAAGESVDAVLDADGVSRDGNGALERVGTLRLLEDEDILEESDDGLAEQERDDAETEVLEGGRIKLLVRGQRAADGER